MSRIIPDLPRFVGSITFRPKGAKNPRTFTDNDVVYQCLHDRGLYKSLTVAFIWEWRGVTSFFVGTKRLNQMNANLDDEELHMLYNHRPNRFDCTQLTTSTRSNDLFASGCGDGLPLLTREWFKPGFDPILAKHIRAYPEQVVIKSLHFAPTRIGDFVANVKIINLDNEAEPRVIAGERDGEVGFITTDGPDGGNPVIVAELRSYFQVQHTQQ